MSKAAKNSNRFSGSWLISFGLHGIIILILLITTGKSISEHLNEAPPARIISAETVQLDEVKELEQLQMPSASAAFTNSIPEYNFSVAIAYAPITTSVNNLITQKQSAVPVNTASRSVFFGTSGNGQRICYLVDISGSMLMAIEYIKKELINSISKLAPDQYFQIIFYAGENPIYFGNNNNLIRASYNNRQKAKEFINTIDVQSVPQNMESWRPILQAIRLGFESQTFDGKSANLFYLFTDGDFEYTIVNPALSNIQNSRQENAAINVILCGSVTNERYLMDIARKYSGQYKFLTDRQLVNPEKVNIIPDNLRLISK